MTKATWYEWDFEPFDKHGDIVDHHHHAPGDLPKDINGYVKFAFGEDLESSMIEGVNLVLVKTRWEDNVWLLFRTWAYVESNELPSHFENGDKVPKRFHAEFQRKFKPETQKEDRVPWLEDFFKL